MGNYIKATINIDDFLTKPLPDITWDRYGIIVEVIDISGNNLASFFLRKFDDIELISLRLSSDLENFCEMYDLDRGVGKATKINSPSNTMTALYRLRYPLGLTEEAKSNYLEYLKKNKKEILEYLIKSDCVDEFYYYFADLLLSRFNIDNNIEMAQVFQKPELVAFLNEYKRTHVEMRNRRAALKNTINIDPKAAHYIIAPFCRFLDATWISNYPQETFLNRLKKYRKKILNTLVKGGHLDAITSTADILLTRQNIDSTLELAIHSHRTELVAFLIEYKEKHFKRDEIPIKLFGFKPQEPDSYREVRKKWHLSDISLKELTLGRYTGNEVEVLVLPLKAGKKNICRVGTKSGIGLSAREVVIPEGYKIIRERAFSHVETLVKITLPESLKVIEKKAFLKCANLEHIKLGNGIDRLKYETFSGCARLKQIQIPDSVKFIEESCFRRCIELEDVEFGTGLKEIGQNAFYKCSKLMRIKIPDNIRKIGQGCFKMCEKLDEVDLGKSLEIIGPYAFQKCEKIKKITIPASLKIWQGAFEGTQIDEFYVEADNQVFAVKDGVLFNRDYTELILYPPGKTNQEYCIPDTVTTLQENCFRNNALRIIVFPSSVNQIPNYLFIKNKNMIIKVPSGSKSMEFAKKKNIRFMQTSCV